MELKLHLYSITSVISSRPYMQKSWIFEIRSQMLTPTIFGIRSQILKRWIEFANLDEC